MLPDVFILILQQKKVNLMRRISEYIFGLCTLVFIKKYMLYENHINNVHPCNRLEANCTDVVLLLHGQHLDVGHDCSNGVKHKREILRTK